MPAITTLTINDGKATPAAHAFSPGTTDGRKAKFVNRAGELLNGQERLEIEVVEPRSATGAHRVIGSMTLPIVETVAGVQVVTRTEKANFDFNFPQSGTIAERKDLVALVANLLANATIQGQIANVEPWY